MIKYLTKQTGELQELQGLSPACWVSILPDFTGANLIEWAHELNIPSNLLTDALDAEKRLRYEDRAGMKYLLFRTPVLMPIGDAEDEVYKTVPIGVILKDDMIITICAFDSPVLQSFLKDEIENFDPADASYFILQLLERNVDYYLECLKNLDGLRDTLEEQLFDSSQTCELQRLLGIDKSLVYFVNSLSANDILNKKLQLSDLLSIKEDSNRSALFEEIMMDNAQALETANMYSNILNGIMDTYGTIISTNLNVTISRLTVITVVLMVPTLIASFYGMNVSLPFEKSPYAFFALVTFAILLSLGLTFYFQRRRMF